MLYEDYFLVPTEENLEHKIEVIKENISRASKLKNKITSMRTPSSVVHSGSSFHNSIKETINSNTSISVDAELDKVYHAISMLDITNLNEDVIIEKINKILSSDNIRYMQLINGIRLKLYGEIILYSKMISKTSSKEELEEIKEIIEIIKNKMCILEELTLEKEVQESTALTNELYFLTSDSGNIILLESIRKNIPIEYYPDLKKLLVGIKNCKYRGLKYLHKISYFEVKDSKMRITFARLSDGKILIIDTFMKKEDTSELYRKTKVNRSVKYLNAKNYYLANMNNPDFTSQHNAIYDEIIAILDSKDYTLGGEDDAPTLK
ncbi:MAG: hypothetical protein E7163_00260 [Firmicutes bacterium]|nr:hypothetical protein [Bacillota bacterium]